MTWVVLRRIVMLGGIGLLLVQCATPSPSSLRVPVKDRASEQFVQGVSAFQSKQYADAAVHFKNVIALSPGSPLLPESQWFLGRAYMAQGEKELAKREFTLLVENYPESSYGRQAHLILSEPDSLKDRIIAVTWSPEKIPYLKDHLRHIRHPGINTVILTLPDGSLEQMSLSPSKRTGSGPLTEWIAAVRREKLQVFVEIPLRTMPWGGPHQQLDVNDQSGSKGLDIFHPETKAMLLRLCRNLAAYPLDGIYVDQMAYRAEEGRTVSAQRLYERLFFERLPLSERGDTSAPGLWRFAGLKSRYITELLQEMREAARAVRPSMVLGVSVPEILLTHPREGLAQASLDYVQLKEAQFDFYVITERRASNEIVRAALKKYDTLAKIWIEEQNLLAAKESFAKAPIEGIVILSR